MKHKIYFETGRLVIREAVSSDADALYALYSDENVLKYNCFQPFTKERIAADITEGKQSYVIALKETDAVIGTLGVEADDLRYRIASRCINYELLTAYTGKGYMSEALDAFLGYCFREFDLEMLSARVFSENERSQRLLYRLGFTKEGTLRRAVLTPLGYVHDDCLFSLMRKEYEARSAKGR